MIGVCIPAHDEARLIGSCLQSVLRAAAGAPQGEAVCIVVVADACSDATEDIARSWCGVDVLRIAARSVGSARAAGSEHLLGRGARWLCCTDADSEVPAHWIAGHLSPGADAVCGTVAVRDWQGRGSEALQAFTTHYQDRDGHRHVHGANLGISAQAYRLAGGFEAWAAHEDVGLVHRLEARQARIAWVRDPQVVTSARRVARAPEGFAAWLNAQDGQRRSAAPAYAVESARAKPSAHGALSAAGLNRRVRRWPSPHPDNGPVPGA